MRRTRDEWSEIVGNYKSSGLSVRRFCREEGIVEQSLRNWITRTEKRSDTDHGFVELQQPAMLGGRVTADEGGFPFSNMGDQRHGLAIHFPDGTSIEVHPDTDRSTLEWVLALIAKRK